MNLIVVLVIREVMGIHVEATLTRLMEVVPQYLGVAGCQDALIYQCEDYQPDKPLWHITLEWWPNREDSQTVRDLFGHVM